MRTLENIFYNDASVGSRLRFFRDNKNLRQKELAEMLNISPSAISKWERNITLPPTDLLAELSEILGVSIDALLGGVNK